ncbi:MAG: response regulator, partial [Lachnospiraceae bacterium]|nr:response regulator [Lachnospiraceae bacterium]
LMDSELKVKSKYGEGSVFYFSVWQKIENPEPMGEYKESAESGKNTENLHVYRESFRAPKARILVVDDTKLNLTVVINLLKATGISIETADNGEAALKLTGQYEYDVILLDQRMPGMDGVETLKAIRVQESGKNTDTPVICLTADAIRGARDRYISEGFTDYITKPVEGEALEKMLLVYLPEGKVEKEKKPEEDFENGKTQEGMGPDIKDKKTVSGMAQDIDSDGIDGNDNITGEITELKLESLQKAGIDTAAGLTYCMNDMEFYQSILAEFAGDYTEKAEKLNAYKKDKNLKNYAILIHSVKSSARTIGAKELADRALELEKAATDGQEAEIEKLHDVAMELYKETVKSIRT